MPKVPIDLILLIRPVSLRQVTWVTIEEVKEGSWGIGGQALNANIVRQMQLQRA